MSLRLGRSFRNGSLIVALIIALPSMVLFAKAVVDPRRALPRLAVNTRPNLVLIVSDDQRADSLEVMPHVRESLAAHGVTFSNAFVTTSFCCPSRASILTGEYSRHTGVLSDSPPDGGAPAFHDGSTLATWLHDAGYTTAMVGKYLNDNAALGATYIPPGWDEWDSIISEPMASKYYGYTLNEGGRLVTYGGSSYDYSTVVLTGLVLDFLRHVEAPFFLYFAPIAPHGPAPPAPMDRARFADLPPPESPSFNEPDVSDKPWGDLYGPLTPGTVQSVESLREHMLESLQELDRSVEAIVRAVADRDGLGNTVFAYTSDNGYLWGEHRLHGKIWPYEESIRVPLVFRLPWAAAAGRIDSHLVLNIDLASTFAQLAGVAPGIPQDGRSLVPLLRASNRSPPWRKEFVVEYLGHEHPIGAPPVFEAIRTERYLYVMYANGWRELYDLKIDPYELSNLAGLPSRVSLRTRLVGQLDALLAG